MSLRALLTLGLVILPYFAYSSAWVKPVSQGEFINNYYTYSVDSYFDSNGNSVDLPQYKYTKQEYNPYLEYGWNEHTTLGLALSIIKEGSNSIDEDRNIDSVKIFNRRKLYADDNFSLSLQAGLNIPIEYIKGKALTTTRIIEADSMLNAGYSFEHYNNWHYVQLGIGYRVRSPYYSDMVILDFDLGLRPQPDLQFLAEFTHYNSINNFDKNPNVNNYDLSKLQMSIIYDFVPDYSVQAGFYRHIGGRYTGGDGGMMVALWHRFNYELPEMDWPWDELTQ